MSLEAEEVAQIYSRFLTFIWLIIVYTSHDLKTNQYNKTPRIVPGTYNHIYVLITSI